MASSVNDGDDVAGAASSDLGALRRNWVWIVMRGVLALVLGVVAFLFPVSAMLAFTMVFAAYAAVDGVLSLVAAVRGARRKEERRWLYVVRGLVGLAVAALFVAAPLGVTIGYAVVTLVSLAAWAILTGLLEIVAALRLRREIKGEWLMGLSGLLSLVLGVAVIILLAADPLATLPSAAWLIGIYAVFAGAVLVGLGLRLRKA